EPMLGGEIAAAHHPHEAGIALGFDYPVLPRVAFLRGRRRSHSRQHTCDRYPGNGHPWPPLATHGSPMIGVQKSKINGLFRDFAPIRRGNLFANCSCRLWAIV